MVRVRLPRFRFDRKEPGFWVSAGTHGLVLLLALGVMSVAAPLPEAEEGVPVEVITENQFSELTKGERNAEKPQDKPNRADRVADTLEDREPENAKTDAPTAPTRPAEMKVASVDAIPLRSELPDPMKEEAAAAAAKAAAAKAEAKAKAEAAAEKAAEKAAAAKAEAERREELQKLVERQEAEEARAEAAKEAAKEAARKEARAKAAAKAKAEADAKTKAEAEQQKKLAEAKAKAEADAKAKAEADAKAKTEAAKVKALAEAKAKADAEAKAKKLAEQAEKFNAGDIRSLIASKAPSQSTGSTGREVQKVASLGTSTGASQKLSPSMRDALIGMLTQQIERCYSAPPGAAQGVVLPMLEIKLSKDGSLSTNPRIMRGGSSAVDQSIAQAALRAVRRCAPYKIPAQYAPYYDDWKEINGEFELPVT